MPVTEPAGGGSTDAAPGVTPIETGRYTCPACTRRFGTLGEKKRHLRTEHERNRNA